MRFEGQQPQAQVNIDVMKDTTVMKCENMRTDLEKGIEVQCDGESFDQAIELRKLSALVSPNGQAGVIPVPFYYCMTCGNKKDLTGI